MQYDKRRKAGSAADVGTVYKDDSGRWMVARYDANTEEVVEYRVEQIEGGYEPVARTAPTVAKPIKVQDAVKQALAPAYDDLVDDFKRWMRSAFVRASERYGQGRKLGRGIRQDMRFRPLLAVIKKTGGPMDLDADWTVDEAQLEKNAKRYADDVIAGTVNKLVAKLGEVDSLEFSRWNGDTFAVHGTKYGHPFKIVQRRIINVSKNGVLFHQWPATVTIDGKKASAKQLAKLAPSEPKAAEPIRDKPIRVRNLTPNQVYMIEDQADLMEPKPTFVSGKTYVEGSREFLERVYARLEVAEAQQFYDNQAAETDAQEAMAVRAAVMSLHSALAKIAKALGDSMLAIRHEGIAKKVKRMRSDRVLHEYG